MFKITRFSILLGVLARNSAISVVFIGKKREYMMGFWGCLWVRVGLFSDLAVLCENPPFPAL